MRYLNFFSSFYKIILQSIFEIIFRNLKNQCYFYENFYTKLQKNFTYGKVKEFMQKIFKNLYKRKNILILENIDLSQIILS